MYVQDQHIKAKTARDTLHEIPNSEPWTLVSWLLEATKQQYFIPAPNTLAIHICPDADDADARCAWIDTVQAVI